MAGFLLCRDATSIAVKKHSQRGCHLNENDYYLLMLNQDDLLLLHHLRAQASRVPERVYCSKEALAQEPGRAAGQVATWALTRTVAHLQRHARRGWSLEQSLVPSAQECRLIQMIRSIHAYDYDAARDAAQWLVVSDQVDQLVDRASPLISFYGAPAAERRTAARA